MADADCPCTEVTSASRVKVEENGKKAVFLNTERSRYLRVRVDGCLIVDSVACDWLVSTNDVGTVFVELKGKDVAHALDQLDATIAYAKALGIYPEKYAAIVVCTGYPKHPSFDTKLQRIKQRFLTKYKAPIHIVCGNHEYNMSNVVSFKGPFPFA